MCVCIYVYVFFVFFYCSDRRKSIHTYPSRPRRLNIPLHTRIYISIFTGHRIIYIEVCDSWPNWGLNRRPLEQRCAALPTELSRRFYIFYIWHGQMHRNLRLFCIVYFCFSKILKVLWLSRVFYYDYVVI